MCSKGDRMMFYKYRYCIRAVGIVEYDFILNKELLPVCS